MPTVWTAKKGAKKRTALLNSGMHRQVCAVDGTGGKSPKLKVYGLLKRLRNALSGSSPTASASVVMKELDNQQKGSKDAAKQAAIAAKADDARAELVRLEAVVDGLMSDEAAAEASEQNYHVLLGQERKFKLDLLRACEEKGKRQADEQGARKAQVNAVDLAVALVKKNMLLLKHFLKGGNPRQLPSKPVKRRIQMLTLIWQLWRWQKQEEAARQCYIEGNKIHRRTWCRSISCETTNAFCQERMCAWKRNMVWYQACLH